METKVERRGGGMPERAFLSPWWSRVNDQPFLSRFIVFLTPGAGCLLTWIRQADAQREWPHDHASSFWSFLLLGSYDEKVYDDPGDLSWTPTRHRRWLSGHVLRCDQAHSITRVSRFTVTLVLTGRRVQKRSYWTPDGKKTTGMRSDG